MINQTNFAQVFTALFTSASKLSPNQVAEKIGTTDSASVRDVMDKLLLGDLLHMKVIDREWRYGITARARRIVHSVGLDGVTDELLSAEYIDAQGWQPRRDWAPA